MDNVRCTKCPAHSASRLCGGKNPNPLAPRREFNAREKVGSNTENDPIKLQKGYCTQRVITHGPVLLSKNGLMTSLDARCRCCMMARPRESPLRTPAKIGVLHVHAYAVWTFLELLHNIKVAYTHPLFQQNDSISIKWLFKETHCYRSNTTLCIIYNRK